jgi:hypothetical protein
VNLAGSHGLITAEWKVGICEFLLLVSLLFFVQAIRLLMYLVRLHGSSAMPARAAWQAHVLGECCASVAASTADLAALNCRATSSRSGLQGSRSPRPSQSTWCWRLRLAVDTAGQQASVQPTFTHNDSIC